MTWARQTLHVARKDVLMVRWLLLGCLSLIVVSVARATGFPGANLGGFNGLFVLTLASMLLAAVLVQADSPARADAFWVTRPLRPSAVGAAKLLVLASLLVAGVIGQALVLQAHDVPAGDYVRHLASAALTFGLWLIVAAVVAALTRDLRMFIVGFVALIVAVSVLMGLLVTRAVARADGDMAAVVGAVAPSLVWLALLGCGLIGVIAHQYLTRRVGRGVLLAGGLIAGTAIIASTPPSAPPWEPLTAPLPASQSAGRAPAARQAPADLQAPVAGVGMILAGDGTGLDRPRADLSVRLGGASGEHRYMLTEGHAEVHRPGGIVERACVHLNAFVDPSDLRARVILTADQLAELQAGVAQLVLFARVDVAERVEVGSLPLSGRGALRHDGWRLRIQRRSSEPSSPLDVRVMASAIMPPDVNLAMHISRFPSNQYTLVGGRHGESLPLRMRDITSSNFSMVLPGTTAMATIFELQPESVTEGQATALDEEWLHSARLHMTGWRSVGSYDIAAAAIAPDASS